MHLSHLSSTLTIGLLLLLAGTGAPYGCTGPVEHAFAYSSDGPSRTGLVPTPVGAVLGNEAGALVLLSWDGREVWRVLLGREIAARPVATENTVVAATLGGQWVGVALKDGQVRWRRADQPAVTTPLSTDGERIFSVAPDGAVEAFDTNREEPAWARPAPAGLPAEARLPFPAPVVLGETLLVSLGDAGLFALRTRDGQVLWRRPGLHALALWGEGARLYATTREGAAVALEAASGQEVWTHEVGPGAGALKLVDGWLWLGQDGNRLLALHPEDGSAAWQTSLPGPMVGRPAAYRELLVVPTAGLDGRLLGLRPLQATPTFRVRLDSPLRAEPLVHGDTLLVPAADGRILGLRVKATPR